MQFGGFTVVQAANGAEAVEQAQKELPDLILMDVRMPKMTGYDACRRMKEAMPELRDIPVVFLSAKGQESEIKHGSGSRRGGVYSEALCTRRIGQAGANRARSRGGAARGTPGRRLRGNGQQQIDLWRRAFVRECHYSG